MKFSSKTKEIINEVYADGINGVVNRLPLTDLSYTQNLEMLVVALYDNELYEEIDILFDLISK